MSRTMLLAALAVSGTLATWSKAFDPFGTEQFVTRPEIKAPRYMVAKHHPEAIAPGYWFVTPYSELATQATRDRREFIPCQTGAHIYDGDGTLIWSGACQYDNRNVFNFKPVDIHGEQHLSFWVDAQRVGNDIQESEMRASGVILNNRYEEVSRTQSIDEKAFDSHEFTVQPDAKSILHTTVWWPKYEATELGQGIRSIANTGFQRVEMGTGKVLFEWTPTLHDVLLDQSCDVANMNNTAMTDPWDWFHINSVQQNAEGDYLVSSRHASTVYKISGVDGHVIWRLGGCSRSDFVMDDDVVFHWQHHARWRSENETHTIISLFDNAGEPFHLNPDIPMKRSSAKVIVLNTASKPMTAKLLRKFERPDGENTQFLGSVQPVSDDSIESASLFVNWAEEGYVSEYDAQDRLVMEAKFECDRQRTYRAYKYPFVGRPGELPTMAIVPLGASGDEVMSAFYVSWNGATEVRSWTFFGSTLPTGPFKELATVSKRGFETSWVTPGVVKYGYAVAVGADGNAIGKSALTSIAPSTYDQFTVNAPVWADTVTSDQADPEHLASDSTFRRLSGDSFLSIQSFVVVGFAIYGAFSCGRSLLQRLAVRQKGYRPANAYSDLP